MDGANERSIIVLEMEALCPAVGQEVQSAFKALDPPIMHRLIEGKAVNQQPTEAP